MNKASSLNDISEKPLRIVLGWLPQAQLLRVNLVCELWARLCLENELWKDFCVQQGVKIPQGTLEPGALRKLAQPKLKKLCERYWEEVSHCPVYEPWHIFQMNWYFAQGAFLSARISLLDSINRNWHIETLSFFWGVKGDRLPPPHPRHLQFAISWQASNELLGALLAKINPRPCMDDHSLLQSVFDTHDIRIVAWALKYFNVNSCLELAICSSARNTILDLIVSKGGKLDGIFFRDCKGNQRVETWLLRQSDFKQTLSCHHLTDAIMGGYPNEVLDLIFQKLPEADLSSVVLETAVECGEPRLVRWVLNHGAIPSQKLVSNVREEVKRHQVIEAMLAPAQETKD